MNLQRLAFFARIVILYCIAVIVWGAFVRASGSGAGCGSHWPLCNGEVLPPSPSWQTWVEFSHRITSGLSLLAVAALAWLTFRVSTNRLLRKAAMASVVLVLLEAIIGAGLVLLALVEHDKSLLRVISISLHLVNTSLLMGALAVVAAFAENLSQGREPDALLPRDPSRRKAFLAFSAGFLLLGVTGAIAALGDTLFRHETLAEGFQADFSATSHWLLPLRIYHPPVAVLWGATLIAWSGQFRRVARLRSPFRWLATLIACNFAIGLINIFYLAPTAVQLLHLLIANLIWVTWIYFGLRLDSAGAPDF